MAVAGRPDGNVSVDDRLDELVETAAQRTGDQG
jgi:hypothetical protein